MKIRRDVSPNFRITERTKICSLHFKADDFKKSLTGRRTLKDEAIPSIFAWSNPSPKRKSPRKRPFEIPSQDANKRPLAMPFEDEIDVQLESRVPPNENDLKKYIKQLEEKNNDLSQKVEELIIKQFGIEKFKESSSDICFYTGFPNYETLIACFNFLNPGEDGENIVYVNTVDREMKSCGPNSRSQEYSGNKHGRRRKLSMLNEFFMVLVRMRLGLFELDLAHRFDVHVSTVNRICTSWINFMYLKFGYLNIWPDRDAIDKAMPQSFKDKYPKTRVIIDATEIKCQMPSSLILHSETYSSYKSHTTFKGLVGIAPSGHIIFISQLYSGSISDRELTIRSGLLKLPFCPGDIVMADKGFTIADILEPLKVGLNIPPFVGSRSQQEPSELIATQEIASERIHVERAINKVKNFQIFNQVIPLSLAGSLNQM